MADDASNVSVSSLHIYPIKSCKGISVPRAVVCSTGFQWDRQWMVVGSSGRMLTQRVDPKLALVEVALPVDALSEWGATSPDSALSVRAPGMELLKIRLSKEKHKMDMIQVTVWEWTGLAMDEGPDAAAWFSTYLQKPCRLVCFDTDRSTRPTDPVYADGYSTTFTDGYPFHLASQASMDTLNEHLQHPLSINQFRPNIIVQGSTAFEEDCWKTFLIGDLKFHGVKLCSRCKVTTTNQETAQVGPEPLVTLRTFRVGQILSTVKSMKNQAYFGQNIVFGSSLTPSNKLQPIVSVGDKIRVIEKASISAIMSKD